MTSRPTLSPADANSLVHAVLPLMVQHGLRHLRPHTAGASVGLTPGGQFVTEGLHFEFMSPGEHRSAAQAYGLDPAGLRAATGPRGDEDAQAFVRALGDVFDLYGVQRLSFAPGGGLGFRAEGQTRQFVAEGVTVDVDPRP